MSLRMPCGGSNRSGSAARSSYFEDQTHFPSGSAVLDNAVLMRRAPVVWRAAPELVSSR